MAAVTHGLGREITLVHALGAVLAGRAPVFVDALGLAFPAAHTRATRAKGRRSHDRGHGGSSRGGR